MSSRDETSRAHRRWTRSPHPERAPFVLVNSLGTDSTLWNPLVGTLSRERDVLRFDARGHGRTPRIGGAHDLDDLVADLVRVLDEEGVDRAHLAGISIGGMTILRLAQSSPERVVSLAPACCAACLPEGEWAVRAQKVRDRGLAAIADTVMGRWFTDVTRATRPDVVARYRDMLLGTDAQAYAFACDALAAADLRDGLASIDAPTVVVAADADIATPPAMQREIADAIPGSGIATLKGAGHIAVAEAGDQLVTILVDHARAADLHAEEVGRAS